MFVFKAKCVRLVEEVNESGREVLITRKGIPMARLVPATPRSRYTRVAAGRIGGDLFTSTTAD